jgi:hypothetical protein
MSAYRPTQIKPKWGEDYPCAHGRGTGVRCEACEAHVMRDVMPRLLADLRAHLVAEATPDARHLVAEIDAFRSSAHV